MRRRISSPDCGVRSGRECSGRRDDRWGTIDLVRAGRRRIGRRQAHSRPLTPPVAVCVAVAGGVVVFWPQRRDRAPWAGGGPRGGEAARRPNGPRHPPIQEIRAGAATTLDVEMAVQIEERVVVVGSCAQPRSVTASPVPIDAIPLQDVVSGPRDVIATRHARNCRHRGVHTIVDLREPSPTRHWRWCVARGGGAAPGSSRRRGLVPIHATTPISGC